MDTIARGLLIADSILRDSDIMEMRKSRYSSFDTQDGAKFEQGTLGLSDLCDITAGLGEPEPLSGKQELYETIVNRYI